MRLLIRFGVTTTVVLATLVAVKAPDFLGKRSSNWSLRSTAKPVPSLETLAPVDLARLEVDAAERRQLEEMVSTVQDLLSSLPPAGTTKERASLAREIDAFYQPLIAREPGGTHRRAYASALLGSSRLVEAKQQIEKCMASPRCREEGKSLATIIDETIASDEAWKLEHRDSFESEVADQPAPPTGASKAQERRVALAFEYEANGDIEGCQRRLDQLLVEYPTSTLLQTEYMIFLLRQDRLEAAYERLAQIERDRPAFENEVAWRALKETMNASPDLGARELASTLDEVLLENRKRRSTYFRPFFFSKLVQRTE